MSFVKERIKLYIKLLFLGDWMPAKCLSLRFKFKDTVNLVNINREIKGEGSELYIETAHIVDIKDNKNKNNENKNNENKNNENKYDENKYDVPAIANIELLY
jgi:hypothetical protein